MLLVAMSSPFCKRGHQIEELICTPNHVFDAVGAKHFRTKPLAPIRNAVYGGLLPKGFARPMPNELGERRGGSVVAQPFFQIDREA